MTKVQKSNNSANSEQILHTDVSVLIPASPTTDKTAMRNSLQADPVLLSVISKLTECRDAIGAYANANTELDFLREKSLDLDYKIYTCISIVGEMVGYNIVCQSQSA